MIIATAFCRSTSENFLYPTITYARQNHMGINFAADNAVRKLIRCDFIYIRLR